MHTFDGSYRIVEAGQGLDDKLVGQLTLVNNADLVPVFRVWPDGPEVASIDIHGRNVLFS